MELEFSEKAARLAKAYRAYKERKMQSLKEKSEKRLIEYKRKLKREYRERLTESLQQQVKDTEAYKSWLHKTRVDSANAELFFQKKLLSSNGKKNDIQEAPFGVPFVCFS